MIAKANLQFTLDTTLTAREAMPAMIVWALSDSEWVLPVGGDTITPKQYKRNNMVALNWEPWGLVLVHPYLPVQLAPSEGSIFWISARSLLQGKADKADGAPDYTAYEIGRDIVCHALPMLAQAAPDMLTPAICAAIEKYGVTKGEYLCQKSPELESDTPSKLKKKKRTS